MIKSVKSDPKEVVALSETEKKKWYQLDSRTLSNLIVVCVGILLYLVLTHLPQVKSLVGDILDVFAPFIGGFIIAYLLNPPVNFFEKKVFQEKKGSRGLAVVTVFFIALVIISFLLKLVLPQVGDSLRQLLNNLTYYLSNLDRMVRELTQKFHMEGEGLTHLVDSYDKFIRSLTSAEMVKKITGILTSSVPEILNFGRSVGSGVITSVTALIASIYMLSGKSRLVGQLKKLMYAVFPAKGVNRILTVGNKANQIFTGFINGKLIDSAIIGVLCFIFSSILRIPYAILVSVVVGVTNVIPFFGPIIGAVPCLMILVIVNPWAALRFGILIVALQQFDGNILGPKILGDSTGLSALWVLVAIVVGGGLFGFPGMLLGVPTFAVIYSLVKEWSDARLAQKGINANGEPLALKEEKDT